MNAKSLVTLIALVLILSACSSAPAAEVTTSPTPESSPNEVACTDYARATDRFSSLVVGAFSDAGLTDEEESELDAIGGTFDSVALSAEGEVADRMSETADIVMDDGLTLAISPEAYFDSVESVARACDSEGFESTFTTWS